MKKTIAALVFSAWAGQAQAELQNPVSAGVILPLKGEVAIPKGSTEVSLVFEAVLDFDYISSNSFAAAQVFKYLPLAISNGLDIAASDVAVTALVAFPLRKPSDYVATAATVYLPHDLADDLIEQLRTPNSPIFKNSSAATAALVRLINPFLSEVVAEVKGTEGDPCLDLSL